MKGELRFIEAVLIVFSSTYLINYLCILIFIFVVHTNNARNRIGLENSFFNIGKHTTVSWNVD